MSNLTIVKENGKLLVDSREVSKLIEKDHKHLLRDIRNYAEVLGKSNFGLAEFFIESFYNDEQGKPRPHYFLTKKGCDMVANKMTGKKGTIFTATYVSKFEEMKAQIGEQKPLSQLEVLQGTINQLVEQDKRVRQLEEQNKQLEKLTSTLSHRMDNYDTTNIEGTPRQRLNKMVRRYATQEGIPYAHAWKEFVSSFNIGFSTNLEARRNHHMNKIGKDVSRPEFLEEIGMIEDAVRIADKMLNKKATLNKVAQ